MEARGFSFDGEIGICGSSMAFCQQNSEKNAPSIHIANGLCLVSARCLITFIRGNRS